MDWPSNSPELNPHRKLLVLHEEEAQGGLQHHYLRQEEGGGHQEYVDQGHGRQVLPEPCRLYA